MTQSADPATRTFHGSWQLRSRRPTPTAIEPFPTRRYARRRRAVDRLVRRTIIGQATFLGLLLPTRARHAEHVTTILTWAPMPRLYRHHAAEASPFE